MLFFNEFIFFIQIIAVSFFGLGSVLFGSAGCASFITLCALLSNLFIQKQIMLFGLSIVACDALSIGSDIGIHLMYEYFGPNTTKKTIWLCLYISIFFITIAQLFLWYQPNSFDITSSAYTTILAPMPFIITSSCLVALATKALNYAIYHALSLRWGTAHFFKKNIIALLVSQLFDTIAFSCIALSGTVHSVLHVILFSLLIKSIIIFSGVPFITFCRRFVPLQPFTKQTLQQHEI